MDAAAAPFRRFRQLSGTASDEQHVWALKDVSFDVEPGEVIGIIGRNGAGKSTLLKVLSKITEPTAGRVEISGRVASLLEVGTGFHPELTGRENIFLNGAILGMSRAEIRSKFDEIVEFSEIGNFLDTPVKRYSSGMYVRLAFAVAAHLEPEILIVDEVLAVGDAGFQRKCLSKMNRVARGGRTVLFVSHNMNAIQSLCSRCVHIDGGRVHRSGDTEAVVGGYLAQMLESSAEADLSAHSGRVSGAQSVLRWLVLCDRLGEPRSSFSIGDDIYIRVEVELSELVEDPVIGIGFNSLTGRHVAIAGSFDIATRLPPISGRCAITGRIPGVMLTPGDYSLVVDLRQGTRRLVDRVEDAARVVIEPRDIWGTGWLPATENRAWVCQSSWRVEGVEAQIDLTAVL
ncbi:MAG: ABC transporter ATP-binding protein [Thermoguttaceae bacterium]